MARPRRHSDDELLARAVAIFWERGFRGTSMRELEARLDARPGSVYARFGSKEALFLAALERYGRQLEGEIDAAVRNAADPVAGIAAYCREFVHATASSDPALVRPSCMIVRALLEVADEDAAVGRAAAALLGRVEGRLARRIAVAQRDGRVVTHLPAARIARLCQLQIIGLRAFAERPVGASALAQLADDLTTLLAPLSTSLSTAPVAAAPESALRRTA